MSDPIYTEILIDEGEHPQNKGTIENPDFSQHDSNPMCGDSITLEAKIDGKSISDIKWDGEGCTICKACTSVLTQLTKGKELDYAKNLKKEEILSELGLDHTCHTDEYRPFQGPILKRMASSSIFIVELSVGWSIQGLLVYEEI